MLVEEYKRVRRDVLHNIVWNEVWVRMKQRLWWVYQLREAENAE